MSVKVPLLVGSYTQGQKPLDYFTNNAAPDAGIVLVTLDTADGSLSLTASANGGTHPAYATYNAATSTAYFTNENLDSGKVLALRVEQNTQLKVLGTSQVVKGHPCYLGVSGSSLLCASYVSGEVTILPLKGDGSLAGPGITVKLPTQGATYPGPVAERQDGPHAHCFEPVGEGGFGLCCDLGSDRVYALSTTSGAVLSSAELPPGCGPRHVAVNTAGTMAYVSTELGNTLCAVPLDPATGKLGAVVASASILPERYETPTTASHVELSPCGRVAYVGNRVGVGQDGGCANAAEAAISVMSIADGALGLTQFVPIGGKVARGFCVVAGAGSTGVSGYLVVGAQESGFVATFAIDAATGKLRPTGQKLAVPSPAVVRPCF